MRDFYFDLLAPRRQPLWQRAGLLLLGVAALGLVLYELQGRLAPELARVRQALRTEAQRANAPQQGERMKPAELAQAWQRAQVASQQLGMPWARFFSALGSAGASSEVALVSVEPDPLKGQVVVVAEARDLRRMLRFVGALQASPDFTEVALQSHGINKSVPEEPVRFRLTAGWRSQP